MAIFSEKPKNPPTPFEKEICEKILQKEYPLDTLLEIIQQLPPGMVAWFKEIIKSSGASKSHFELDIFTIFDLAIAAYPGDIIIKTNRDPKVGDIIKIGLKVNNEYTTQWVKLLKMNIKESTIFVCDPLNEESRGVIGGNSILFVLERVIHYDDPDWKQFLDFLKIEYDIDDIRSWILQSIEYVRNNEIYDKENTLKKLETRLKMMQ